MKRRQEILKSVLIAASKKIIQENTIFGAQMELCGVTDCCKSRKPGIFFHKIPQRVMTDTNELTKWKSALKLEAIPEDFVICSHHFKKEQVYSPILKGKRTTSKLLDFAFPTENLPKSWLVIKGTSKSAKVGRKRRFPKRTKVEETEEDDDSDDEDSSEEEPTTGDRVDKTVQWKAAFWIEIYQMTGKRFNFQISPFEPK